MYSADEADLTSELTEEVAEVVGRVESEPGNIVHQHQARAVHQLSKVLQLGFISNDILKYISMPKCAISH